MSSPSLDAVMLGWRHFATTIEGAAGLLELRQAQPALDANPSATPARVVRHLLDANGDEQPPSWRAGSDCGSPATAPASGSQVEHHRSAGDQMARRSGPARPGTPASAPLASLRSHGGSRPHTPAWGACCAAPAGLAAGCAQVDASARPPAAPCVPARRERPRSQTSAEPSAAAFAALARSCIDPAARSPPMSRKPSRARHPIRPKENDR